MWLQCETVLLEPHQVKKKSHQKCEMSTYFHISFTFLMWNISSFLVVPSLPIVFSFVSTSWYNSYENSFYRQEAEKAKKKHDQHQEQHRDSCESTETERCFQVVFCWKKLLTAPPQNRPNMAPALPRMTPSCTQVAPKSSPNSPEMTITWPRVAPR